MRTRVKRAKQSQFPVAPGGTRPGGRGPMGRVRKTKPIPSRARWDEVLGTRAVEGNRAKQSQFGRRCPEMGARRQIWDPCRGRWCKTKPIPAMAGGAGLNDGDSGVPPSPLWPLAFPGPVVQTKPICLGAIWRANAVWKESYDKLDPRMAPAEQSQFPPPPQWPGTGMAACAVGGTHRAKRTQYPAGPGGAGRWAVAPSKLNLAAGGTEGKCAKRTQLGRKFQV